MCFQHSIKIWVYANYSVCLKLLWFCHVLNSATDNEGKRGENKLGGGDISIYTLIGITTKLKICSISITVNIWQCYVIHWKIEKYEYMYCNCKIVNKKNELMIVALSSTRTKEVHVLCLWNWRQEGLPFLWSTKARYRDICNTDYMYLIWYSLSVFVTIVKSFTRKLIWPISWTVENWHEFLSDW